MSEQITLHYQCRLCGKQLDRGIHLGPPSPGTCSKAAKVDGFHGPHRWVIVSLPQKCLIFNAKNLREKRPGGFS